MRLAARFLTARFLALARPAGHLKQTGWPIQEWRRRAFPPVRPPSPDPLSEVRPPSPSFAHIVDHHRLVRFIQTWHVVAGQISGPKALRTPTVSL